MLGGIAAVDPGVISIEAVEEYIMQKTKSDVRVEAARDAYEEVLKKVKNVARP